MVGAVDGEGGEGGGGLGTHWKPLNTSEPLRLENPNQGRPGGDNERWGQ